MLRGKWLFKGTYEIVRRGGIWAYTDRRGLQEKIPINISSLSSHSVSQFLPTGERKIEQIIELQYLESAAETCQCMWETENVVAPISDYFMSV